MYKKLCLCLCMLPALLFGGCGFSGGIKASYNDISLLRVVQTIGLDGEKDGGAITLTAATGKSDGLGAPAIISRDSHSLVRAMAEVQDYSAGQQIYFSHTRYVVLGEEFARKGVDRVLDYIARDVRMRMGTELFVLRSGKAQELITGSGSSDYNVSSVLDAVKQDVSFRGDSHVYSVRETIRSLCENGAALVCALKCVDTEGSVYMTETGLSAVPDGYGVLKGGSLAGFISGRDALAVGLLMGNQGTSAVSVDYDGSSITLDINGGSAKLKPRWGDGGLECIELEAEIFAAVAETDGEARFMENREYMAGLEKALALDVEKRLKNVTALSSRLDADFLGVGGTLRRDDPLLWGALPRDWLKNAKFEISVKCTVDRSYDLGDPINFDGSGK